MTASAWHFEKYRALAMSIASSGVGMGVLLYPMLIRYLYVTYGWRGALLILGGVTCNMMACGATYPRKQQRLPNIDANPEKKGVWNINIFRNIDYTLLCFNSLFNCIGLSVVYVHMAAYAEALGVDPDRGALLFTTIGIANFLGRFLYTGLVQLSYCSPLLLHVVGYFLVGIFTLLVPLSSHYSWLVFYAAMFGSLSASIGCMLPLIIVDLVGADLMASGYGNQLFFQAVGQTAGGPFAGEQARVWSWSQFIWYHTSSAESLREFDHERHMLTPHPTESLHEFDNDRYMLPITTLHPLNPYTSHHGCHLLLHFTH